MLSTTSAMVFMDTWLTRLDQLLPFISCSNKQFLQHGYTQVNTPWLVQKTSWLVVNGTLLMDHCPWNLGVCLYVSYILIYHRYRNFCKYKQLSLFD
ncbi:hypothetical protein TOT_040000003 [Theileria orientalis strain Shintoku]|uniref:Uncharacterized protein n=1 Tax=Theileria orientalis strain Shintoku TaxID=869250 RepID=J4CDR9_THEOR|nr:hypothetical protein TOT_040000003 [Theileria orientalis strain Shintoku]PVC54119.1 hypothetical protein MACL_00003299 [Theileria orientalis]BAM41622.1 hypothetical protein TOT_040000003 [Theileria orientalis strain Shintoku]|eukprot:XP_009691923.1 hypothetical protein TOT_040000003 [Theileria orientalis strain Shintoku]